MKLGSGKNGRPIKGLPPRFTMDSPPTKGRTPLFRRRHHFVIAKLISQSKEGTMIGGAVRISIALLQANLADTFQIDNPSGFNRKLFNEMCIPEDERRKE